MERGQPKGFVPADCHVCSILSDIAYDDNDPDAELTRLKAETKCTEFLWLIKQNDPDVDENCRFTLGGFVTKDDNNIYIVFRGTQSHDDVVTDLRLGMVPTSNLKLPFLNDHMGSCSQAEFDAWDSDPNTDDEKLDTSSRTLNCFTALCSAREAWEHKGFSDSVSSVWWDMEKRIKQFLRDKPLPVILTGHSLGGASAMLMAFHATFPIKAVYTFGQPRVGGSSFAFHYQRKKLHDKTFRLIHDQDLIPRSPFVSSGYRHVGHSLYMTPGGKGIWNLSTLALLERGLVSCCTRGCRGAADHSSRGYREDAEQILKMAGSPTSA